MIDEEVGVREYSVPEAVAAPGPDTNMALAVVRNAEEAPDAVLFSRRGPGGGWEPITATRFALEVAELAKGLIARGIEPGDRIGLMSSTRYEWTLLDYAIWTAGGVTVPIYETSSAEQLQWILADSGSRAVFLETSGHQRTYQQVAADLPGVTETWQIEGADLQRLAEAGGAISDETLDQHRRSRGSAELATLIYTSGTTGRPKGCELTHSNLWGTGVSAASVLPQLFNEQGSTLLFLPLAHVFGRLIQGACVENRVRMGHTHDVANLVADLSTFRPTFLLSVPRVFEKVYNAYQQQAHASGRGALFDRGEKVAVAYSQALDRGGPGIGLRWQHALFEKVMYGPKLRAPLGGELRYAVSGGAPLGARLGHFFRGIGITVLEGYGLTESTAAGAVNTVDRIKIGTVGQPSPGVSVRIADGDNEILMKGRSIFRGYWNQPSASAEALVDGWFHTGDIGELDDDGFLRITGRKKEILVTAAGKNVAPAPLEDRIRSHPLVSQAVVIGDNEKFVAALITLDADALGPWKRAHDKPDAATAAELADDPDLHSEIQHAIDQANESVSHAEAIKAFRVLPVDFSEQDGTLTPSMKVKRNVVMSTYKQEVAAIYGR
ncbi:MAG TPA: AMP-dependent synthetase/ligase [Mycobacteriales bacterium]|nr:AMP-dependent synthetase/ligase [Mycobacteriales bacterium]